MKTILAGNYKANRDWPVGSDFRCRNSECACVFRVEAGDSWEISVVDHRNAVELTCPECDSTYLYQQAVTLLQA